MSSRNVEIPKSVAFFVPGEPVTQGSMRAYRSKRTGKPILVHDKEKELSDWRDSITAFARRAWANAGWDTLNEPLIVQLVAYLPRPKTNRDAYPVTGLDLDKLQRAAGDALSPRSTQKKPVWKAIRNDSRIIRWEAEKTYAHGNVPPGVFIRVIRLPVKGSRAAALEAMRQCGCAVLDKVLPAKPIERRKESR